MNPASRRRGIGLALTLTILVTGLTLSASSAAVKPKKKKRGAAKAIKACANRKSGQLRIRTKGRPCRKRERTLVWSVRGPRGAKGARGVEGAPGSGGPGGSAGAGRSIFSARAGNYVTAFNPGFAAVMGATAVTATESLVQTLAPPSGFSARNLTVRATAPPGGGNTLTLTLRAEGAETALRCTIADAATTCGNTTDKAAIAGSSAISLQVTSTGNVPATSLMVAFDAN